MSKREEKLKEYLETLKFNVEMPPPTPKLAYITPLPKDQHRDYQHIPMEKRIHTPLLEILSPNLLAELLNELNKDKGDKIKKTENYELKTDQDVKKKESKLKSRLQPIQEISPIQAVKQKTANDPLKNLYLDIDDQLKTEEDQTADDILRNSFGSYDIVAVTIEPSDIVGVYDLYPDEQETQYDTLAFSHTGIDKDVRLTVNEWRNDHKIPKIISINEVEYDAQPMDMSDYVFLKIEDGKATWKEIGANLKLRKIYKKPKDSEKEPLE